MTAYRCLTVRLTFTAAIVVGTATLLGAPNRPLAQWVFGRGALRKQAPAETVAVELGPYVQYVTPSEAVVRWWTRQACPSIVEYGPAGPGAKYSPSIELRGPHEGELEHRLEQAGPTKRHALKIGGLRPNEVYGYRVTVREGDAERSTDVYELDTALNYSVRPLPKDVHVSEDPEQSERMRALAREVLLGTGVTKGYCLVWGIADGSLAYALAAQSDLTVLGVDDAAARVSQVRRRLSGLGVYGTRVSVQQVDDMAALPYPDNFANLIVSERMLLDGRCLGTAAEMHRVLRPRGGAAVFGGPDPAEGIEAWLNASAIDFQRQPSQAGVLFVVQKPVPAGIGSWTHQYGDAGNSADSHDDLGGASTTDEMRVQWLGKPGADFGADRNPRMPAPLAAGGRLFHQGMSRMVALDAYNGTILWSLEIPAMQRVNLPRDASNWCADEAFLYVAINDKCWMIEQQDGGLEHVLDLPGEWAGQDFDWGYVARKDHILFGSAVRKNAVYTDFWGGDAWYDKTTGFGTEKVCSDGLFAYDLNTKDVLWAHRDGLVINTTVAVGDQGLFFVESRSETLDASPTRRLNDEPLWSNQYLVALDAETGERLWETNIDDTADGIVVFFLACRDDTVVIASSAAGTYHLYTFDSQTGTPRWHAEHKWPGDNHGAHMQHPVVLADKVFLEPCGYDLRTGRRITSAMSGREGCATYCGTQYALIHRGRARRITMWDFNTGQITGWHNLRPSCWLSTVAGEGMVLSPEGGGGCSCGNWLETSLVFAPIQRSTPGIPANRPVPR